MALNLEQQTTGNLFQKKTKAKLLDTKLAAGSYLANCVYYIHNNPFAAGLVMDAKQWEFSSLKDYAGLRRGTLCNKSLLFELTGISEEAFKDCRVVEDAFVRQLF